MNHQQRSPGDWKEPLPPRTAYPEGYLIVKTGKPHAWLASIVERSPYRPDRLFDDQGRDRTDGVFAWCELEPDYQETTNGDVHSRFDKFARPVSNCVLVGAMDDGANNSPDFGGEG